jgi:hypothetical protein
MKRKFRKNLKGISTIIATIIIVAIAIVMAIAVAYWAMGIGGSFTRFERITIVGWATSNSTAYTIHMIINNTGTAAATINPANMLYNGKPGSAYASLPVVYLNKTKNAPVTMYPGDGLGSAFIVLLIPSSEWKSGMSLEVDIQTAAGNLYPKTLQLP